MNRKPDRDGWAVVPWDVGRGNPIGVAIQVSGRYEAAAGHIWSETTGPWRRIFGGRGSSLNGRSLPVLTRGKPITAGLPELSVVTVLCDVLYTQPALRARLDEPERMIRLAADLNARRPMFTAPGTGVRRDSTDIHVALVRLGLTHPHGRPLTRAGLPPLAEMTEQVAAALRSNTYRIGRPMPDRQQIERIVTNDYLGVEPWPFAALADP